MATMRSFKSVPLLLLATALAVGCSLVNALDDVTPPRETAYTTTPKVDPPLSDGGAADGDALAPGDHAVLVVGGRAVEADADDELGVAVLAVLDTANGHELGVRENMHVAGVVHDAPRDLWYIFEAPTYFIAGPSEVMKLHIRQLSAGTGAWTELSSTVVPTLVFYDAIAVTNSRLTFMAHPAEAGGAYRMVTLDTSNPAAPTTLAEQDVTTLPIGMIATRSGGGPGGQVTLLNVGVPADGDCPGAGAGLCSAKLHRFLIPNGGVPKDLGTVLYGAMSTFGLPAYGSVVCGGGPDELLLLPKPAAGPHDLTLLGYQSTEGTVALNYAMATNATRLRRAAVDNARRVIFVVETNTDTNIHAIALGGGGAGSTAKAALRHSGQAVYYDPASQTAFAPFNQGEGHTFSAFRVNGTSTSLQLRERVAPPEGDWGPPLDLRPVLLGIRDPATFNCP